MCVCVPAQCGKALNERKAEIRIQLKKPPNTLFPGVHNNEIVIRIQPNEAMWIKVCVCVVVTLAFDWRALGGGLSAASLWALHRCLSAHLCFACMMIVYVHGSLC